VVKPAIPENKNGFLHPTAGGCPGGKQMIPDKPVELHIVSVAKFLPTSHRKKLKP